MGCRISPVKQRSRKSRSGSLGWWAQPSSLSGPLINHGAYGGSFLWTPKRRHHREAAKLRGENLFLLADLSIPVRELLDEQIDGVARSRERGFKTWIKLSGGTVQTALSAFKSPPPGYERRSYTP